VPHTFSKTLHTDLTHDTTLNRPSDVLQRTATHCNTLQHTATHCNTLQHTATRTHGIRLLQHTATHHNTYYILRTLILSEPLKPLFFKWFHDSLLQTASISKCDREVGGWGRVPFSRNLMSPTPRRKWYLTTGRRFH